MNLLPCPFCGSEETRIYRPMQTAASNYKITRCEQCGSHGPRGKGSQGKSAEEAAGAAWNRRVDLAEARARARLGRAAQGREEPEGGR